MDDQQDQHDGDGFFETSRQRKVFRLRGGRLSESEDRSLTETVTRRGIDGDVVATEEAVEAGRFLDCGCTVSSPKGIAGECRRCGALICQDHAGMCEAEGALMCRRHLREVVIWGEVRTYCTCCSWLRAPFQMLLGLASRPRNGG